MKRIIIYILIVFIGHSCVEEAFRPCKTISTWMLDEEVRDWKVYGEGEMLTLYDDTDSIAIRCKNNNHGIEEVQKGICPPDFNEYISMGFEVSRIDESIYLKISYRDQMAISYDGETMRVAKGAGLSRGGIGTAYYQDSVVINERSYYNAFNFEWLVDSFELNQLIYSTNEGIILLEVDEVEYTFD